jgi:excisionase family DNA binding protein
MRNSKIDAGRKNETNKDMRSSESEQQEVDTPGLLLDVRAASRFMGISPWQCRSLISAGSLPIVRVGRKFYFRRSSLLRWAERAEESLA